MLLKLQCASCAFPGQTMQKLHYENADSDPFRPGVGPWVFGFVKSSQEMLILLVKGNHAFIARLSASINEQRLENVTCQPWHGIWLRGQPERQRDLVSKSGSVVRWVTEPGWVSQSSSAKWKHGHFLRRLNKITISLVTFLAKHIVSTL